MLVCMQGSSSGAGRAQQAALQATSSPLLDVGIDKATGVVWNITGPPSMTLHEVREEMGNIGVRGHRLDCYREPEQVKWEGNGCDGKKTVNFGKVV